MGAGTSRTLGLSHVPFYVLLAVLQALVAIAVIIAWSRPASSESFQAMVAGTLDYTVDTDGQFINVAADYRVSSGVTEFEVLVPATVGEITATAPYQRSERDQFWDVVAISPGGSSAVGVEYRVGSGEVRTDSGARVNESFIGFTIWPTDAEEVTITVPDRYVIAENRGLFEVTRLDTGQIRYAANYPDDLQDYSFVAFSGESFESRTVKTEGDTIQIAGWLGDDAWLDHTEKYVTEGVPTLRELIGLPWPETGLEVVESARPEREGYAGWYLRSRSLIEIRDTLDEVTLLHELSHAWFNDRFYTDRWIIEGMAEEMASAALVEIDGVETDPPNPGQAPEGWDGLLKWQNRFETNHSLEIEVYGYRSAWYAIDRIADELGEDRWRTVLTEMQSGRPVYGLPTDPSLPTPNDWRRFLDVLEEYGQSETAAQVYRDWVVPSDLKFVLDARDRTRADVKDFSSGEIAAVPLGVRRAMARWEFDSADRQLDQAKLMWERSRGLTARATDLGLSVPAMIDDLYLRSGPDFSTFERTVDEAEAILSWFELGEGTADDLDNFELGRFEEIDEGAGSLPESFATQLNADREEDAWTDLRWAISFLGLVFVLVATLMLLARLKHRDNDLTSLPPPRPTQARAKEPRGETPHPAGAPPPPMAPPPPRQDA